MNKNFQFTIAVRDVREALPELRKLAPLKSSLPILSTVLIERDKGATRLTATDLDARLTYEIPSEIASPVSDLGRKLQANRSAREDGAICVPVAHLTTALKNADKASDITITANELTYRFTGNKASLGGDFLASEEFPHLAWYGDEHQLSEAAKQGILAALPCATTDESRYILLGVYYEGEENSIVATDGRQAIHFETPLPQIGNFIMPKSALRLLTGKIAKLPWSIGRAITPLSADSAEDGQGTARPTYKPVFQIRANRWTLQSKTIEGNYPNWRQVVPAEKNAKTAAIYRLNTFNRLTIADSLKRLPKNTASEHDPILVGVGAGDQMKFSADKQNSFAITLAKGVGNKPRCVNANRAFWQRLVALGCTEIRIENETSPVVGYKNGQGSAVADAANLAYVFMPVRLSA